MIVPPATPLPEPDADGVIRIPSNPILEDLQRRDFRGDFRPLKATIDQGFAQRRNRLRKK
jgi:hypothetical protein